LEPFSTVYLAVHGIVEMALVESDVLEMGEQLAVHL
jgi:hypothetical protein